MTVLRQLGSHSSNRMNGKRSAGDMISRGAHWLARSIPFELTAFQLRPEDGSIAKQLVILGRKPGTPKTIGGSTGEKVVTNDYHSRTLLRRD
jgi:hypothetical protein